MLFLCALTALHLRYAAAFRPDSDETQHLHVVWGWTQGQLPYRDFFDNHAPLFSLLCAPLFKALGERADILLWMRLFMLPLVALGLVCIYRLGRCLFGRRASLWAAVATGYFPLFFYTSCEFRTDTLWTTLWLLSLSILFTGPPTAGRLFFFGAIFGLVFATSLKTTLLAVALLLAALPVFLADHPRVTAASVFGFGRKAIALAAGLAVGPGAFAAYFVLAGAWKPFVYCLVSHNILPGMARWHGWLRAQTVFFPLALTGLFIGAGWLLRRSKSQDDPWRIQRTMCLATAFCYPLLLFSFWPLLTRQDYLPAIPLLMLGAIAGYFKLAEGAVWKPLVPAAFILVEVAAIFSIHGPWRNRTGRSRALLAAVLRLTGPQDFVMDLKGETVFRRRPFYFALEDISRERIRRGLIADDIAQRLVATRTAAVHTSNLFPLPEPARAFVSANYLSVGPISVLGKIIGPQKTSNGDSEHSYPFEIAVPADYVVIGPDGNPAAALLDGEPLGGRARRLQAGPHEITSQAGGSLIVLWANAWSKGFRPVALSATSRLPNG